MPSFLSGRTFTFTKLFTLLLYQKHLCSPDSIRIASVFSLIKNCVRLKFTSSCSRLTQAFIFRQSLYVHLPFAEFFHCSGHFLMRSSFLPSSRLSGAARVFGRLPGNTGIFLQWESKSAEEPQLRNATSAKTVLYEMFNSGLKSNLYDVIYNIYRWLEPYWCKSYWFGENPRRAALKRANLTFFRPSNMFPAVFNRQMGL